MPLCGHSGGRPGGPNHPARRGPAGRRTRVSGIALLRAPLLDAPQHPKKRQRQAGRRERPRSRRTPRSPSISAPRRSSSSFGSILTRALRAPAYRRGDRAVAAPAPRDLSSHARKPCPIVRAAMGVTRETAARPPSPAALASAAAKRRRRRWSRGGNEMDLVFGAG